MPFHDIPEELKQRQQWIVWRYEDIGTKKPTKVPYNPNNVRELANVNDKNTWSSFDNCVGLLHYNNNFDGIGFVFTANDPYTFIDLDDAEGNQLAQDRQINIFKEFDSYSEVSPSGKGLHIIIKGLVPSGRRRSYIEVYSTGRYATFTGVVYNRKPIANQQDKLMQLWEQMGSGAPATHIYKGDDKQVFNDNEIVDQAKFAVNGDKFLKLFNGLWVELGYPSQSEADIALINIIAFYTQNRIQIERIFKSSQLGKRDKAKRKDYISFMINKSFDKMLPQLDFDGFKNALENKIANQSQFQLKLNDTSNTIETQSTIPIPPGLLGEIADFIYKASPRPVPEIALAGAIGLMAGICGRAYNISGTGLNQYVLLLADTGTGKDAITSGIDILMNKIRSKVPTSKDFIGPARISSGQALVKYINKNPCFVSVIGEFGLRLGIMAAANSSSAEKNLESILLELYTKSGHGKIYRPSIFADTDKNVPETEAPSFSLIGESVPERFYSVLTEDMIANGLLPRFMIIEYNGVVPPFNYGHENVLPSWSLEEKFMTLVANCEVIMHAKRVVQIKQDEDAENILKKFEEYARGQMNGTSKDVIRQLWNRAHMKALKLSALISIGVNMADPLIISDYANWAINLVQHDIKSLSVKFEAGLIGHATHETKQIEEAIRVIKDYVTMDWVRASKYCDNQKMHFDKVVPYSYLSKRLMTVSCFRHDRQGATQAIKRVIQIMTESDRLRELGRLDLTTKYNTTQKAFVITNTSILN